MNPHARLYSPDAAATVRSGLTGTDAGSWTPGSDAEILDAREWEHVHVFPEFVGGAGTSVNLTPLYRIRKSDGSIEWREGSATGVIGPVVEGVEVLADGHFMSFRLTALALGTATSVNVRVSGGRKRLDFPG
jgi:hypothetical protein